MSSPSRLRKSETDIAPEGLIGDLYNASPSVLSQRLYDTNKAKWPNPELETKLKEAALQVQTIQEYLREKAGDILEWEREFRNPSFEMDVNAEIDAYLSDLDPARVARFNQIVEEIRSIAHQEDIDIPKLKELAAEQFQIIYGTDERRIAKFRKELGLS